MKPLKALTLIPVFATLAAIAPSSQAGSFAGRLGIDGGGDKLLSLRFSDGETSSIKAGGGVFAEFGYGTTTPFLDNPTLQTDITFGYKNDSETASNGDVDFRRLSVNLNQLVKLERFRVGAGLTYHFDNKLKTSGQFFNGNSVEFDKALGFNLIAEYIASDRAVVGLRATFIDYEFDDGKVDGNSIGIYLGANY